MKLLFNEQNGHSATSVCMWGRIRLWLISEPFLSMDWWLRVWKMLCQRQTGVLTSLGQCWKTVLPSKSLQVRALLSFNLESIGWQFLPSQTTHLLQIRIDDCALSSEQDVILYQSMRTSQSSHTKSSLARPCVSCAWSRMSGSHYLHVQSCWCVWEPIYYDPEQDNNARWQCFRLLPSKIASRLQMLCQEIN